MNIDADGPTGMIGLLKFRNQAASGVYLHPDKVAMFPKNFREIAALLPQDNKRAKACSEWLLDLAAEYENGKA